MPRIGAPMSLVVNPGSHARIILGPAAPLPRPPVRAVRPFPVSFSTTHPRVEVAQPVERPSSLWRPALCVGLLGALALLSELSRRETVPRGDDLIYERMAQHPLATHTFPFAFRIGLPWLVHVLPFSHTVSFELLAWVAAGGAAAFAFVLMSRLDAPRGLAAGLALALATSPPMLVVALREGRNTDAITI